MSRLTFSLAVVLLTGWASRSGAQVSGLNPTSLTVSSGRLFFIGQTDATGTELFVSDASGSTRLVKDITPGPASSDLRGLVDLGGTLLFFVRASDGPSLWKSDGTEAGTVRVASLPAGSDTTGDGRIVNGRFVFFVEMPRPTLSFWARELWRTDGTAAGTAMLASYSGSFFYGIGTALGAPFNGFLYYITPGGLTKTDGNEVSLVFAFGGGYLAFTSEIAATNTSLFFNDVGAGMSSILWASDGTSSAQVAGLSSAQGGAPFGLCPVGNELFVAVSSELWMSDATNAVLVKDINPGGGSLGSSFFPSLTAAMNGIFYFAADDGTHGLELWRSDGTGAGTYLVKDVNAGSASGLPSSGPAPASRPLMLAVGSVLYFIADDGVHGTELWRSDGTAAGTVLVKDIAVGPSSAEPASLTAAFSGLVFSATDAAGVRDLWWTDGTDAGTHRLQETAGATSPLIVARTGAGSGTVTSAPTAIDCGSSCTASFAWGDSVTLSATAADGSLFAGWSSGCPGLGTCTVTMDAVRGVVARFVAPTPRYRLFNDITKEHHYTTDANEYAVLGTRGWVQEGVSHQVLKDATPFDTTGAAALYRLYQPGIRQHLWTTDRNEYDVLANRGWMQEGTDGYLLSAPVSGLTVPLYRLAHLALPLHLWTTDLNEYTVLVTRGWMQEGVVGHVLP